MSVKQRNIYLGLAAMIAFAGVILALLNLSGTKPFPGKSFDKDRAFKDAVYQVSLGPRTPMSDAHKKSSDYITKELTASGWAVEKQVFSYMDKSITNIVARRGEGSASILIGAHYDSRLLADKDPDPVERSQPVPGANDGASGVAILLELARCLPDYPTGEIWLVFFDAEDQGKIPGWEWIIGSNEFASSLTKQMDAVVIIDMVGDVDLNIKIEKYSSPDLVDEIWGHAASLGYSSRFLQQPGYSILDDHVPFLQKGIKAVDIIDFDYPFWHTTNDTVDKISAESLEIVGTTLLHWLDSRFD
jgi:glutaminyl-peptide cyclotransferase